MVTEATSSIASSVDVSVGARPLPTDFTYNNQSAGLVKYVSLNNTEITVGAVEYDLIENLNVSDLETAAGRIKRYARDNKRTLSISYSYLPSSNTKTVDGRQGRDFIYNLAANAPAVTVNYKDDPTGEAVEYSGFIDNYSEKIIRRDVAFQCTYYEVSFEVVEA